MEKLVLYEHVLKTRMLPPTILRTPNPQALLMAPIFHAVLTLACNANCKHCYDRQLNKVMKPNVMPLEVFQRASHEFALMFPFGFRKVYFAGGEPFMLSDERLMEYAKVASRYYTYLHILTNGWLIPERIDGIFLKDVFRFGGVTGAMKPTIQISFEGTASTHDSIRGRGAYKKALRGLEAAYNANAENKVMLAIMMTVSTVNANERDVRHVLELGREFNVARVGITPYVPLKGGKVVWDAHYIEGVDWIEFMEMLYELNRDYGLLATGSCGTGTFNCSSGRNMICMLPDGSTMACRRHPTIVGKYPKDGNLRHLLGLCRASTDRSQILPCVRLNLGKRAKELERLVEEVRREERGDRKKKEGGQVNGG